MATPNMGMILPVDGDTANTWGAVLDTALGVIVDAHDHSAGKGVRVSTAGLNINADLPLGTFALTGGRGFGMTPVTAASMAAYADIFFANSSDANNLYYRNHAGANVRVTNGSTLDITLVGGIGGDYSAVGALLDYDDASDTYRLRQQVGSAVRQFGKMSSADVNLFEYKAQPAAGVPANAVTLKSPASLAASYTLTMPAAVPAAANVLTMANSGAVANDGVLGANQNLTFSGTGYQKRGNFTRQCWMSNACALASVGSSTTNTSQPGGQVQVSSTVRIPIHCIDDNERLQSVHINNACVGAGNTTVKLQTANNVLKVFSDVAGATASVAAGAAGYTTLTPTTPAVQSEGNLYWLCIITPAGATWDFSSLQITADTP